MLCVDRQGMVDDLLYGRSEVVHTYVPAIHPLYPREGEVEWPYDPQRGNALLDEAGYDRRDAEGFRLDECVAYADSSSDLPLFEAVGFPVAVNPETRLATIARKRGWLVENWSKAKGAPKPLLPIGDMLAEHERRRVFS